MIRRFNYTGRAKILRQDIKLALAETDGHVIFEGSLDLAEYELPPDALVFLEAYRQTKWMRFPLGSVGNVVFPPPYLRRLTEFEAGDHILFRIKVTPPTGEHKLLAAADRVPVARPEDLGKRDSLLEVAPAELGDEIWRLDLDDRPQLQINKSATDNWKQLAQSKLFQALVYPGVLRQILESILDQDWNDSTGDDWRSQWLRFASLLPGMGDPPVEEGGRAAWVEDAVSAFAKKHSFKKAFVDAWVGGET